MARRRKGRPLSGVLLVDKAQGASSNQVLQQAKRLFNAAKAGHTGALDPLATGLLPLCFGEATKFSQMLLDSDKVYQTTGRLGIRTDTCDADGEVTSELPVPETLTEDAIESLLESHFQGEITQFAPLYSALKVNGRPMYELARQGVEVKPKERQVTIYRIELTRFQLSPVPEFDLEVHCSKGTYIRSIVDDLGQMLGCGAHVTRLHRLAHGPYQLAHAHALADLADQPQEFLDSLLLPTESALVDWPAVTLSADQTLRFLHGNPAQTTTAQHQPGTELKVYGADGTFLGVGESGVELVKPKRVVNFHPSPEA